METPFGGCAGIMSMPRTRPFGNVRSTATLWDVNIRELWRGRGDGGERGMYLGPGARGISLDRAVSRGIRACRDWGEVLDQLLSGRAGTGGISR